VCEPNDFKQNVDMKIEQFEGFRNHL
jgi:hypothetical protein